MCPKTKPLGGFNFRPTNAPPKQYKGKAIQKEGKEGFILVRACNKGRDLKRTLKDRQEDEVFNRFDALEDLEQFDGAIANIPIGQDFLEVGEIGGEENNDTRTGLQEEVVRVQMDTNISSVPLGELGANGCKDV